jgi:hypothetical protein
VPRAAKLFFIPVVRSPLGAVEHVTVLKLPSQEGRAPSHGTRDSAGSYLSKEARVWGHGTRGSGRVHLSKDARFGAEGHVMTLELTSARR